MHLATNLFQCHSSHSIMAMSGCLTICICVVGQPLLLEAIATQGGAQGEINTLILAQYSSRKIKILVLLELPLKSVYTFHFRLCCRYRVRGGWC